MELNRYSDEEDRGILKCSYHGHVTNAIHASEIPECSERHRKAGCPLALTWVALSSPNVGYRG